VKGVRRERVAEEIHQILSDALISRVEDPRLRLLLVNRVEVSPDMAYARVFVSVMGSEQDQEAGLRAISRARTFFRSELARRGRLRRIPELTFFADPGVAASLRLQQILDELGLGGEGGSTPGGEDPDAVGAPPEEE
jgi:ribosome-binding factor A